MLVSVLIPTYKRLQFLKCAVEDVLVQTFKDWEIVVSDDEVGEGETWKWLKVVAAKDQRIRIFKNEGPKHGQVFNVNNGLNECRGEWIKVLFDDDRMLPVCLEKMVAAARRVPDAVMIGCRAQKWRAGAYVGDEKNFARGDIDVISKDDCKMAILKYDRWNGRTPTHMLIRSDAIRAGALMPMDDRYKVPVDVVWFSKILGFGSYAMMRDILVQQREGEVASVTSCARSDEAMLDAELQLAYRDVLEATPLANRAGLTWRDVAGEICGVRGVYHLKSRRYILGVRTLCCMFKSFTAPFLTLRWLLQESFPRHFNATRRKSLSSYCAKVAG